MAIVLRLNDCMEELVLYQRIHRWSLSLLNDTVGSEDFGETIIGHGQTGNGPDADVGVSPTTQKKDDSRSFATDVRGTKRFVRPECDGSSHSI